MATKALDPDPEFTVDAAPSATMGGAGPRRPAPKRAGWGAVVVAAVLAAILGALAFHFLWPRDGAVPQVAAPAPPAPASPAPPEPAIQYPVGRIPVPAATDTADAASALPKLDESDGVAKDVIGTVVNGDEFVRLLVPDGIIRRIVATVDNLPRRTIAVQVRPIRSVPGAFATIDTAGGTAVDGANAVRYAPYVRAAEAIDARRLAGFYVRLYPLFQQAYVELGYPNGYFNDRLIGVIDHLLAAPEPASPVYLSQPRVMYEFADPGLEALSAGQKILVRVGIDNERILKAKLREIRAALTGKPAGP
jgi:hypothetical protein